MRRVVVLMSVVVTGAVVGWSGPSAADCASPYVEVDPDAGGRGSPLTVTGHAWGTNCYDTGPPPPGEGPLGVPQTGIRVVFVDAVGAETVLATVNADAEYGFTVEGNVPATAAAGPGRVTAESRAGGAAEGEAFTVTADVMPVPAAPAFTG